MIYATEQQVVITVVLIVIVAIVALFMGMWWGHGRGMEQAEEEARWKREEARARRTHPVYRWHVLSECPDEDACPVHGRNKPPEVAHEAWLAHEETALIPANSLANEPLWMYQANDPANVGQVVHVPVQVSAITTGEIQAITDEMDAWLAVHVYSAPADYGAWLEREGR